MENMEHRNKVISCCKALNSMFDAWFDAGVNIITSTSEEVGFAKAVVVYDEDNPNACCIGIIVDDITTQIRDQEEN